MVATGNYAQDVFFRVVKLDANGTVLDARYYDTYAFRWVLGRHYLRHFWMRNGHLPRQARV
jgi:hypothetical protein